MSSEDEGFRQRIGDIIRQIQGGIASALRRGQAKGTVRQDIDPDRIAGFCFAAFEGTAGLAKNAQSLDVMRNNLAALSDYLETLRPSEVH